MKWTNIILYVFQYIGLTTSGMCAMKDKMEAAILFMLWSIFIQILAITSEIRDKS